MKMPPKTQPEKPFITWLCPGLYSNEIFMWLLMLNFILASMFWTQVGETSYEILSFCKAPTIPQRNGKGGSVWREPHLNFVTNPFLPSSLTYQYPIKYFISFVTCSSLRTNFSFAVYTAAIFCPKGHLLTLNRKVPAALFSPLHKYILQLPLLLKNYPLVLSDLPGSTLPSFLSWPYSLWKTRRQP